MASSRNSSGVTFLEMMLVITILSALVAIVALDMPLFTSGFKLRGATREVATDLQYARLLAVKENRDIQITFDSYSYQVLRVSDGSIAKSRSFGSDYPGVSLTNGSLVFDSRGTFDPMKNSGANSATVTISNLRGSKNITVQRTGRVKVE